MKRAIIDSRPWLLLSLLFAVSYYFVMDGDVPGLFLMLWKGAGVGLLAVYCLRRSVDFDGWLITAVMALGALGDMLIELDMIAGAVAFLAGHFIAIWLYARNRRSSLAFSQRLFAIMLVPIVTFIAWMIPYDRAQAPAIALYTLGLTIMAAMAWTSRFPRYRVGVGALLFVISDLLIFTRIGFLQNSAIPDWFVWPLYYIGQFLIATGVVRTLRQDHHIANP